MRADEITEAHIGKPVYGLPGIAGWEEHLLLQSIESRADEITLMFRWNDDPSPSNSKRGQFAWGTTVPPETPVRLTPKEQAT